MNPRRITWVALSSPSPAGEALPGALPPEAVGHWALAYTPRVARLHCAWVLDVGPTLRLWGGWATLLPRLRSSWPLPQPLHLGVGLTPLAAQACATVAPSTQAEADCTLAYFLVHGLPHGLHAAAARPPRARPRPDLLASLPSAPALRDPDWPAPALPGWVPLEQLPLHTLPELAAHLAVWEQLGVHTWGELDRLPRAGVVRRWGPGVLRTLDRAWGRLPHPLPWLVPPQTFVQTLELPAAAEHAPALHAPMQALLQRLCRWLQARQQAAQAVRWRLHHDPRRDLSQPQTELLLHLAQPLREPLPLLRLSRERLARLKWPAPVVRLGLELVQAQPWQPPAVGEVFHPAAADGAGGAGGVGGQGLGERPTHTWEGLLDQLRARLGEDAVRQWQPCLSPLAEASQAPMTAPARGAAAAFATLLSAPSTQFLPSAQAVAAGQDLTGQGAAEEGATEESGATEWLTGFAPGPPAASGEPAPPWAAFLPPWLALPPRPLPLRNGWPHWRGPLRLLSGPHRVEWTDWTQPHAPACVRDHHIAHSPGEGLLWVAREHTRDASGRVSGARWWLLGWWA